MSSTSPRQGSRRANAPIAKPRTPHGAIGGLIGALVMSIVAGLLVTVAVTPVVAVSGYAAGSAISVFENLPSHLDPGRLAQPSVILAKDAEDNEVELASFYAQNREMVGWDDISQYVKDAAVSTEDPRYYTHSGVDVMGLGRAVIGQVTGNDAGGASTISMQYVRNVLVQRAEAIVDDEEREAAYEEAVKEDVARKLQEIRYAIAIEKKFTKDEILVGYLNIALFGRNIYGIEAAAQTYYGKSAKDLTLAEAASLVGIVKSPGELHLFNEENIPANQARRDYVLARMLDAGRITQQQYDDAVATDVVPNLTVRQSGCVVAEQNYALGHFCDYVQRVVENDPAFGNDPQERHFNLMRGGYRIMTTIDLDLQQASVEALRDAVPQTLPNIDIGGAAVTVQPGTGRVLAMAQNRPFNADEGFLAENPGYTSINYNTDSEYGGSNGFQTGSTIKTFTLAEWLRSGNSVNDTVNGNARKVQYSSFRASCLGGVYANSGDFTFRNYADFNWGNMSVMRGTVYSVNAAFTSMQQRLDLCDTIGTAQSLGVHRASDQAVWTQAEADAGQVREERVGEIKNFTLNDDLRDLSIVPSSAYSGADEIAPITMATAYAAFVNEGKWCSPVPIDAITDADGQEVGFTKSTCTQGVSPEVSAGVLHVLNNVTLGNGTGAHARSRIGIPRFMKTGITNDEVDYWNVGGTTNFVTAVWTGNAKGKVGLYLSGLGRPEQKTFTAIMNAGDLIYGGNSFPDPPRSMLQQVMIPLPDVRGMTYGEAEQLLERANFTVSRGEEVDSAVPEGLVAGSNPSGEAGRGSHITLSISRGNLREVPGGLVGGSAGDAQSALANAGFSNLDFSCVPGGGDDGPGGGPGGPGGPGGGPSSGDKVVSVSPDSGSEVKPDSRVTVRVECD